MGASSLGSSAGGGGGTDAAACWLSVAKSASMDPRSTLAEGAAVLPTLVCVSPLLATAETAIGADGCAYVYAAATAAATCAYSDAAAAVRDDVDTCE
jgi:hypothetical protein